MSELNWTVPTNANSGFIRCTTDASVQVPVYVFTDPINSFRMGVVFPDNGEFPVEVAGNFEYAMPGYAVLKFRATIPAAHVAREGDYNGDKGNSTLPLVPSTLPFPQPDSQRDPLLPVEAGDEFGNVSSTFPPEFLSIPGAEPQAANVDLIRGDAYTYTTPFAPSDINPLCDTAWLQSIGQNTNFGNRMWYTPLLPLYPSDVQDAFLADYSKYNTHLMLQGSLPIGLVRATCVKAKQYGLYVFVFDWVSQTFLNLLEVIDGAIIGLEVDKIGSDRIADGELDGVIAETCAACVPKGVRVWLHFTSSGGPNHVQHWAFPSGGMSYTDWWAQNDRLGVTGLMYQAWDNTFEEDSAGKMGAMMFYARQGLHFSSNCLVCACEIMSVPPFYGEEDGPFAYRRSTEMVCCSNGGIPNMVGVAGSFNGPRKWDGRVM